MNPFKYKNTIVEFEAVCGIVKGYHKSWESVVRSSGGGGYIQDGSGYVSAPSVHSTSVIHIEFFIQTGAGKEEPVQFTYQDIPIRDGQKVTAFLAHRKELTTGYWVKLINHNTGMSYYLLSAEKFVETYRLMPPSNLWIIILVCMAIFACIDFAACSLILFLNVMAYSDSLFTLMVFIFIFLGIGEFTILAALSIPRIFKRSDERSALSRAVASHLNGLV